MLRKICYFPLDAFDTLLGRRDELTPPRGLVFVGGGDFKKVGDEFLRHFIELGSLRPDARVLDIGCGIGRMAVPLIRYLENGTYEGFDIVPDGIDWCNDRITPKFPNFHFQLADVYNKAYNPHGSQEASQYRFPYNDGAFDFAFATSVFTHMLPAELDRYTQEMSRVLKPGERCLATFFLLNDESLRAINEGRSQIDFKFELEGFRTSDRRTPESAVAYPEKTIHALLMKHGLATDGIAHYGSWSGKTPFVSFQDIIVARKS